MYIARILMERTDEENAMTAQGIADALEAYGIPANRKSVYNDIEALRQFGVDIVHRNGKCGGYFVASRDFDLPELKLLVDAVQSSRLVAGSKCGDLIGKLTKLASAAQAKQLRRQVYVGGCAKSLNETVYYAIDAIHAAINAGKKISFKYFDYNTKMQRTYRKGGKPYVRTPIALCWNEDKYYLLTYCPDFEDPCATYRVDRMENVEATSEDACQYDRSSFNVAEYIRKTFGMYSGETVSARLAFHESLVCVVLDQFGNGAAMTEIGGGRFAVNVEVSASPVFLGWMFQLGDKAEILAPESLRAAMRGMIESGRGVYCGKGEDWQRQMLNEKGKPTQEAYEGERI